MVTGTATKFHTYEGMFLFPQGATGNLQAAVDHVMDILGKIDAEIISFSKWDERRLAYEIKGNKRGVYFLAFFKAEARRVGEIERQCNLSEQILRALVTRADYIPAEHMQAAEGREKLADEIKLRSQEGETATRGSSSVTTAEQRAAAEQEAQPDAQAQPSSSATATAEKEESSGESGGGSPEKESRD